MWDVDDEPQAEKSKGLITITFTLLVILRTVLFGNVTKKITSHKLGLKSPRWKKHFGASSQWGYTQWKTWLESWSIFCPTYQQAISNGCVIGFSLRQCQNVIWQIKLLVIWKSILSSNTCRDKSVARHYKRIYSLTGKPITQPFEKACW